MYKIGFFGITAQSGCTTNAVNAARHIVESGYPAAVVEPVSNPNGTLSSYLPQPEPTGKKKKGQQETVVDVAAPVERDGIYLCPKWEEGLYDLPAAEFELWDFGTDYKKLYDDDLDLVILSSQPEGYERILALSKADEWASVKKKAYLFLTKCPQNVYDNFKDVFLRSYRITYSRLSCPSQLSAVLSSEMEKKGYVLQTAEQLVGEWQAVPERKPANASSKRLELKTDVKTDEYGFPIPEDTSFIEELFSRDKDKPDKKEKKEKVRETKPEPAEDTEAQDRKKGGFLSSLFSKKDKTVTSADTKKARDAEEEARRKAEEEERKRLEKEEEERRKEEQRAEAKRIAEEKEAARKKAEEEAAAELAEKEKRAAEERERREAQKKAEAEAKKAEAERKKAEAERRKAELEKAKAEADARKKEELERQRIEAEKKKAEEKARKAEEERLRAEEEHIRKEEEEKRKAEEEIRRREEEARRAEEAEAERKRKEEEKARKEEQKRREREEYEAKREEARRKAELEAAERRRKREEEAAAKAEARARAMLEAEEAKARLEAEKAEAEAAAEEQRSLDAEAKANIARTDEEIKKLRADKAAREKAMKERQRLEAQEKKKTEELRRQLQQEAEDLERSKLEKERIDAELERNKKNAELLMQQRKEISKQRMELLGITEEKTQENAEILKNNPELIPAPGQASKKGFFKSLLNKVTGVPDTVTESTSLVVTQKPVDNGTIKKASFVGHLSIFVTSLEHSASATHTASGIASALARTNIKSCICHPAGTPFPVNPLITEDTSGNDEAYVSSRAVVYDRGTMFELTPDQKKELRRSDVKIMCCKGEEASISTLARFIHKEGDEKSHEWIYVFNTLSKKRRYAVEKLLLDYDVLFLDAFDIDDIEPHMVKQIIDAITTKSAEIGGKRK